MKKRVVFLCLALTLVLPVLALAMTAGTYEGTGLGNNGEIKVAVTVSETGITGIEVLEHKETAGIGDNAIAELIPEIIGYQSLGVDHVSGATNSSNGLLSAIGAAIAAAGGDVEAMKAVPVVKNAGAPIEKEADVIVVGAGGAGIAAAITAAENGASVIIIDKAGSVGGNTIISGGVFNAVDPERQASVQMGDSSRRELESYLDFDEAEFGDFAPALTVLKEQIRAYLASGETALFDTVELHVIQTYIGSKRTGLDGSVITADYELVRTLCENALDSLHWLEDMGVQYESGVVQAVGALWPRTHTPVPANGVAVMSVVAAKLAETEGCELMTDTEATEFIMDGEKVVGVKAVMRNGTEVTLKAKKNVVLATGGFASNIDMIKEYNNYWPAIADVPSDAAATCNGDGIRMAERIGANLVGMGYVQMLPTTAYPDGVAGLQGNSKLFINKEGRRFVNESAERDVLSAAGLSQTDGMFYCVADANYLDNRTWDQVHGWEAKGYLAYADTLEEAAEKMGLDPAAVRETIDRFNTFVDNEKDEDFDRYSFKGKIETAPFIIIAMSPAYHHTMGGVQIDKTCHVINRQGGAIPGLFAAGEVCGGIHAGNRLGGNAIADVFTFGRIAGAEAAK